MFSVFKTANDFDAAVEILFDPDRDHWLLKEYLEALVHAFILTGPNCPPWKILLDFLPLVKREALAGLPLPKTLMPLLDLEIVLAHGEEPPLIVSPRLYQERKLELHRELKAQCETLDERNRNLLQKRIDRLEKDNGENSISELMGYHSHSEAKIVLYPQAFRIHGYGYALSILAHELFHAYHANLSETMQKDWLHVSDRCPILIERLASYNEFLFLEDSSEFYRSGFPNFGDPTVRCEELEDEALSRDPELWPYSGFIAIRKRIESLSSLNKKRKHQESQYLRSLLNEADVDCCNEAILLDYYLTT